MINNKIFLCLVVFSVLLTLEGNKNDIIVTIPTDEINKLLQTANQSTQMLTNSLQQFMGAYQPSSLLASIAGIYCTHALFCRYLSKPHAQRETIDWALPAAGLTLSVGTLYLLSRQQ